MRRRAARPEGEDLVRSGELEPGRSLPLLVEPASGGVDLAAWAGGHREWIETRLVQHGAVLFRGFGVGSVDELNDVVAAVSGPPLEYTERSSPRSEVGRNVYTSTDYPPQEEIFPHNEHSYKDSFPLHLYFYCEQPADTGGATPLADCRRVYQRIPEPIRQRFLDKGYIYQRNFGEVFGLPWQTVFGTRDPAAVEDYCRRHDIQCEWREGRLRTRQRRRVAGVHPVSGETSWFNHLTFFHLSTLPPAMREALASAFDDGDLPNQTYYGDGSPIEPEVVEALRQAYRAETVRFPWQRGDVLLVDNLLTSHAREAFSGPRRVLVAMSNECAWTRL